jgi:hypothetical protein
MPAPVFSRPPVDVGGVPTVSNANDVAALNVVIEALHDDIQTRAVAASLGTAAGQPSSAFATAAQGALAATAVQPAALAAAQTTLFAALTAEEEARIAADAALQLQVDGKAASSHTHPAAQISDGTAAGRALLTAADAAAQRTALGLGTAATTEASAYATAAQGAKADSAVQPVDLLALQRRVGSPATRPGEDVAAFASVAVGAGGGLADFPAGATAQTVAGLGLCLVAQDVDVLAAPRVPLAVQPGRVYRLHAVFQRQQDPADPSGDTVQVALQLMNANFGSLGVVAVDNRALVVADGVRRVSATFQIAPTLDGVTVGIPASTVYLRPFVRCFGTDHRTALAQIEVFDITDAATLAGVPAAAAAALAAAGQAAASAGAAAISAGAAATSAGQSAASAGAAAVSAAQAQLAAVAAGAPIVTALTAPTPADGTVELLLVGTELEVWQVQTGAWVRVGVLGGRASTRAEFVALNATLQALPAGAVVQFGGEFYRRALSATWIGDAHGFVPQGAITAAHWGLTPGRTTDCAPQLQAMIHYAESIATDRTHHQIELVGTGDYMPVASGLVNHSASITFTNWKLKAIAGAWSGALNYTLVPSVGQPSRMTPQTDCLMRVGWHFRPFGTGQQPIKPVFGDGFALNCDLLTSGLAIGGVESPVVQNIDVTGPLVFGVYVSTGGVVKDIGSILVSQTGNNSDENTPYFRTAYGLWTGPGADLSFGDVTIRYCRVNILNEAQCYFTALTHPYNGWKGSRDLNVFYTDATFQTVVSGGVLTGLTIVSGGTNYSVGDTLYIERYPGDTALDFVQNRHHNFDNWRNIACIVVTAVDTAGAITGWRFCTNRHGEVARGAGYVNGETRSAFHIQLIQPYNLVQRGQGEASIDQFYMDKGIVYMDGAPKMWIGALYGLFSDDVTTEGLFVFKAKAGQTNDILSFQIDRVKVGIKATNPRGYTPSRVIVVDQTEATFRTAQPRIAPHQPNGQSTYWFSFPSTEGSVQRFVTQDQFGGTPGAYFFDWNLADVGFAGSLYALPCSRDITVRSALDQSQVFRYRYLPEWPAEAPGITDPLARAHTVRVFVPDAVRLGGHPLMIRWAGMHKPGGSFGGFTLQAPSFSLNDQTDLGFLYQSGDLGDWLDAAFEVYQDAAGTVPCTTPGQDVRHWKGRRGLITWTQATAGAQLLYGIDARGRPYVYGDGASARRLVSGSLNLGASSGLTAFAGIVARSGAASGSVIGHNGTTAPSWRMRVPRAASAGNLAGDMVLVSAGGSDLAQSGLGAAPPVTRAVVGTIDLAAAQMTFRNDGRSPGVAAIVQPGAALPSGTVSVGGNNASGSPFNGDIYQVGFVNRVLSDEDITEAVSRMDAAMGRVFVG